MMRRDATQLRGEPFRNDSCTLASNELPHERVCETGPFSVRFVLYFTL